MRRRMPMVVTGLVGALAVLAGCTSASPGRAEPAPAGSSGPGPTTPAPSSSGSGEPSGDGLPSDGAPKVKNPLDTSRFQQDPCLALAAAQAQELNLDPQGKPMPGSLGNACDWRSPDPWGGHLIMQFTDRDPRGLSAVYKANKAGKYVYFIELPEIEGYPAVALHVVDRRDKGSCSVDVGVSDRLTFGLGVSLSRANVGQKDPCEVTVQVAGMMLRTMKAGLIVEEGGGAGLTPHEIYVALTSGPRSGSLDIAQQAASAEARLLEERAERIKRIAGKVQAGWRGSAADGAHGAAGPLADLARADADQLQTAQELLGTESGSFGSVYYSVRPVPPVPPQSNVLNDLVPWETDLDRDIKQYQEDAQHNLALYGAYDSDTMGNQSSLPVEYPAIADPGGDIAVRPAGQPDEPRPGGPFMSVEPKLSGGQDPTRSGGPDGGDGPVGGPPPPNGGQPPPQATDPSEVVPGPTPPPGSPPVGGPPPGGPPTATGPGPILPTPVGVRGPGAGADGGPGFRGGAGEPRPGQRGTGGPGGRGAGGEHGVGGRPGAGALAAEEAARRGGVGAAGARGGAAGMGGVAPMGAGRGQRGEDTEHERKYTIEPDPEELFGTDEATAPPVLGEDKE